MGLSKTTRKRAATVRPAPRPRTAHDEKMDAFARRLGDRILSARLEAGMTQTDLGNALGKCFQQVQKYEKGISDVSAVMLTRIAEALDKPLAFFLDDDAGFDMPIPDRRVLRNKVRSTAEMMILWDGLESGHRSLMLEQMRQLQGKG